MSDVLQIFLKYPECYYENKNKNTCLTQGFHEYVIKEPEVISNLPEAKANSVLQVSFDQFFTEFVD